MSHDNPKLHLPDYDHFIAVIEDAAIGVSGSELHGVMCGYLCAGADAQGEAYLHALLHNKKDEASRNALLQLFAAFTVSQQQINNFDFEFQMLLPDDDSALIDRAQAFGEWCDGFNQGLSMAGISADEFYEEEAQEALQHMSEFAELDYEALDVSEEDERALMEVSEYARLAVIRLHGDLILNRRERGEADKAH